jgi:anaerobic ribonucleoside-triphosphate reductase activating protein
VYVARVIYPVEVLGPGRRVGIWFDGCPHRCPGCISPELQETDERYRTSVNKVMRLVALATRDSIIDGVTISGGEPFAQAEALWQLVSAIRPMSQDILVYSGYTHQELKDMRDANVNQILAKIAVLIDGRYIAARNVGTTLCGSDNQQIVILDDSLRKRYEHYCKSTTNELQNFMLGSEIITVGIQRSECP